MKKDITIIILAGGKSSRMKQDKGFVMLRDKRMIEHVLDKAKKLSDKIIIIANNTAYQQFGFPSYADLIKDCGPIGGIYTGLVNSTAQKNLVLSCDAPFINEKVLATLIEQTNDEDVLAAEHSGKTEPLCAIYDLNCKTFLKKFIDEGSFKMMEVLQKLNTVKINFADSEPNENWFANINTPEELQKHQQTK